MLEPFLTTSTDCQQFFQTTRNLDYMANVKCILPSREIQQKKCDSQKTANNLQGSYLTSCLTGVNNVQATKWMQFVNQVLIIEKSWGFSYHSGVSDFPSTSSSAVLHHLSNLIFLHLSLSLCLMYVAGYLPTPQTHCIFSITPLSFQELTQQL